MNRRTTRSLIALTMLFATTAVSAAAEEPAEETWRPELLAAETETTEALAAGPEKIRDGAGIYLLRATGFELIRPSSNGFHCLVGRSQRDAFEPQCFDAEGSATVMQQVLLAAELRMAGKTAEEIQGALGAALASGQLRAPARPGINYMLSKANKVPVSPDQVIPYRPHVMFYAPYLDNEDVGGDMAGASPVFVISGGTPFAYVIVPVP